ncbi:MAG: PAS domain-containing protein, partial [Anaerolineae bacterium]|nr:PAS domain-containing protein [Anaerolineae bacterium]
MIPIGVSLFSLFRFPITGPFDWTIIGMTVGVLLIGWALFGFDFADVNPIARASLIESLKDGVIVVDSHCIITDINPAAIELFLISKQHLGQHLDTLISDSIYLPSLDLNDTYPHQEIMLTNKAGTTRDIDLRASPLLDRSRVLRGWLLLLRDISDKKKLEKALQLQSSRNEALAEIELAINQPHELAGVLQKIVNSTVKLLPAPGGVTILMWNKETRTFERAESSLSPENISRLLRRAKQGRGSASWIIENQQPKLVPDTREDPFGEQDILTSQGI